MTMESKKMLKALTTFIVIAIFITTKSTAQSKDSITYNLPDFVRIKISKYLANTERHPDIKYFIHLQSQNDTTIVLLANYNVNSKETVFLLKNSNRYLKVNSATTLPILLMEDLLFSDVLHHLIKAKQKGRYDKLINTELNPAGYLILFKGQPNRDAVFINEQQTRY